MGRFHEQERGPTWRRSEVTGGGVRDGVVGREEEGATGLAADGAAGGATGLPQKHPPSAAPRKLMPHDA